MGLFTPAYMKNGLNRSKLQKAVAKVGAVGDQNRLREIALNAPAGEVREAAISRLSDRETLVGIALNNNGDRKCAIDRLISLGDQAALAKLLIRCKHNVIYWTSDVIHKVLAHVSDQVLIGQIAKSSLNEDCRMYAAERLQSQEALAEIALKDTSFFPRRAAIRKLQDGALLAKIAQEDRSVDCRACAVSNPNLTDMAAIRKIAQNDREETVRGTAIGRLDAAADPSALTWILRNDRYFMNRLRAAEHPGMTDAAALVQAALTDEDGSVAAAAARNPAITDAAQLEKIARKSRQRAARCAATERMTDPVALAGLAREADDGRVRETAVRNPNLTDQALFGAIAAEDGDSGVRTEAMRRIEDVALRVRFAVTAGHIFEGEAAIRSIDDPAALALIAENSEVKIHEIRWEAAVKLIGIDPAQAVKPLVTLMKDKSVHGDEMGGRLTDYCRSAVKCLVSQYSLTEDPEVRAGIASVPKGMYGYLEDDDYDKPRPRDERVYFGPELLKE